VKGVEVLVGENNTRSEMVDGESDCTEEIRRYIQTQASSGRRDSGVVALKLGGSVISIDRNTVFGNGSTRSSSGHRGCPRLPE